jgi:hypothetical protein
LSTGVRFVHTAEATATAPWQTAYERAARETFVIVLLAAALVVGLIGAAGWLALR